MTKMCKITGNWKSGYQYLFGSNVWAGSIGTKIIDGFIYLSKYFNF